MISYSTLEKILAHSVRSEFKLLYSPSVEIDEEDQVVFSVSFESKGMDLTKLFDPTPYKNEEDLWGALQDFPYGEETRIEERVKAALKEKLTQGIKSIKVNCQIFGLNEGGDPDQALANLNIQVEVDLILDIPEEALAQTILQALQKSTDQQ